MELRGDFPDNRPLLRRVYLGWHRDRLKHGLLPGIPAFGRGSIEVAPGRERGGEPMIAEMGQLQANMYRRSD